MSSVSGRSDIFRLALYATPIFLAALAGLLYFSGGAQNSTLQTGSVQVAGSETMRPVVTACAEDFMTRNPQADIIVKGGGSGDGIAALLHGLVDVGMTSRDLSRRELDYALSKGIDISTADLARDGIAIIVNRANPIAAFDLGQLQKIFSGKILNWRDLDGAEADILTFARAEGSGTASLFGERILGQEAYALPVQRMPTNEAIVAEVATRPGAIGYTGLGALRGAGDRVKVVAIRADPQSAPIAPTSETIRSGTYPLTRTLHLATAGKPSETARAFIEFCSNPSGHALLERAGYVALVRSAK